MSWRYYKSRGLKPKDYHTREYNHRYYLRHYKKKNVPPGRPPPIVNELGLWLRNRGMHMGQFAAAMLVTIKQIQRWLKGAEIPRHYCRLAHLLFPGIPVPRDGGPARRLMSAIRPLFPPPRPGALRDHSTRGLPPF